VPRTSRVAPPGFFFHVTNRGNERRQIFFGAADYRAFLRLLAFAKHLYPVRVHGLCVMPNHFHALVQPVEGGALSAYLRWVLGCYSRDLRSTTGTTGAGHVFQQRFWSQGVRDDRHFLCVLRYIEANPVKARLVPNAEDWPWSSLSLRMSDDASREDLLDPLPVALPPEWTRLVNEPQPVEEVKRIERPVRRGRPRKGDSPLFT
jgi:putative transposase